MLDSERLTDWLSLLREALNGVDEREISNAIAAFRYAVERSASNMPATSAEAHYSTYHTTVSDFAASQETADALSSARAVFDRDGYPLFAAHASAEIAMSRAKDDRFEESCAQLCDALIRYARLGELRRIGDCLSNLGTVRLAQDRHMQAEAALLLGWEFFAEHSQLERSADCSHGLGATYLAMGRYRRAEESFTAATVVFAKAGLMARLADSIQGLGNTYEATGRFDLAAHELLRAKTIFEELGDVVGVAEANQNLGVVFESNQQFDEAEEATQRAHAAFLEARLPFRAAECKQNLGIIFEICRRTDEALQTHQSASDTFTAMGSLEKVADCDMNIGVALRSAGRFDEAQGKLTRARSYYSSNSLHEKLAWCDVNLGLLSVLQAHTMPVDSPSRREEMRAGLDRSLPAVLFLDAQRFQFAHAPVRQAWARQTVKRMAAIFEWAAELGDSSLVCELIETAINSGMHVAGTDLVAPAIGIDPARLAHHLASLDGGHRLVAWPVLPMSPPPKLRMPDGNIALEQYISGVDVLYARVPRPANPVDVAGA
ncbi:tetratricopeptide repeat protein [Antrihabitans spumae]|uniref:Tetratricopeptide repeat protein n=1 Tax=Antrihabitans spumae TaxID=3373370 RepID=A0ABW7KFH5_9NOCA